MRKFDFMILAPEYRKIVPTTDLIRASKFLKSRNDHIKINLCAVNKNHKLISTHASFFNYSNQKKNCDQNFRQMCRRPNITKRMSDSKSSRKSISIAKGLSYDDASEI